MRIYEYKVTLFLEIESDEKPDPLLVEEAITSLFEREINATNVCLGLAFALHDVDDLKVEKT